MIIRWVYTTGFDQLTESEHFLARASEILRAHRMGIHLLVLDRQLAASLARLPFAEHEKALITRLSQEYTQTGRLHEFATAHIQIKNEIGSEVTVSGSSVLVPLNVLSETRALERPALLVENGSSDGWLYNEIIKYVSERSGRGNVAVEIVHGGGTSTPDVLSALVRDRRIVYAIVDSDRDCPTSPASPTLEKVGKVTKSGNWPLAKAGSPPVREVENVVPIDLLFQLACGKGNSTNSILIEIAEAEIKGGAVATDMYMNFFDIKLGLSSQKLKSLSPAAQEWISSKLALAGHVHDNWTIGGYGERVVPQISADGYFIAELRRLMSGSIWRSIHWGFFTFVAWFFVSAKRVFT